jgi:uncharacterized membrane protein YozB (DUF420 family)
MERTQQLQPYAVYGFVAVAAAAVVGFWPQYFSQLAAASAHAHAHGIAMSLWCLLLIAQASLIRAGRRDIHRQLGKLSFVLMSVIVIATLSFANAGLKENGVEPPRPYILYLQLSLLSLFVLAYLLAMYNRRQPVKHARFMVCTALTLIDPILFRILLFNIWAPENFVYLEAITYSVMDLILVALIASNWRRELRLGVYPAMLAVFIVFQTPTFFIDHLPGWEAFAAWYMGLPLS